MYVAVQMTQKGVHKTKLYCAVLILMYIGFGGEKAGSNNYYEFPLYISFFASQSDTY